MSPRCKHRTVCLGFCLAGLVLAGGRAWAGESPWYIATRFGESRVEVQLGSRNPKWVDDEASAAAVEVGYDVNRYLALEAGYQDLGSHAGRGSPCRQTDDACIERLAALGLCAEGFQCAEVLAVLDADISGFSLALVPHLSLGERLSVRGKLGLISWAGDVTARDFGTDERFSGEDILTGIGLQYDFPGGLGIRLQHEELDLDASWTSLGLSWHF